MLVIGWISCVVLDVLFGCVWLDVVRLLVVCCVVC